MPRPRGGGLLLLLLFGCLWTAPAAGCSKCPSRSDVVFTSRSPYFTPGDKTAPRSSYHRNLTTWSAAAGFHATRLDWVYTLNASFIAEAHARGLHVVTPAMIATGDRLPF